MARLGIGFFLYLLVSLATAAVPEKVTPAIAKEKG